MGTKLLFAAMCVASSGLLVFCVGDDQNNQDASTKDAQPNDVVSEPPAQGFTIALAPSHVTADPGDSNIAIAITVSRAAGFADDVAFTITPPAHVTATNAVDTGNGGTTSSFSINVDNTMPLGTAQLTVTASNPTKTFVQNAKLDILVGTLADLGDAGTFTVPSWATSLTIKAWGAGGGATCQNCQSGGTSGVEPGGGGGFASGTFAVTPNSQLVIIDGTGGAAGFYMDGGCSNHPTGGGGGGFSAVQVKGGSFLVIAGGGGGTSYYSGTSGGGGGGASGETANAFNDSGCLATGGSQTAGGNSGICGNMGEAGASLQGGNGYNTCSAPVAAGGVPGGGSGGVGSFFGNGGGGGGFFGGGGGGEPATMTVGGAGGGGSGHVASDAGTLVTATGATPANTSDPDFVHCANGTANGGATQVNNGAGGAGCIVIHYTKP